MSDVPNDLLRKKGVADEQLAKKAEERGRQRSIDENEPAHGSRKRSRSVSSYSSTSVSTISTNLSRSVSPKRPRLGEARPSFGSGSLKRRRSTSISEPSYSSDDSYIRNSKEWAKDDDDRNTRRRRSSVSPDNRGRDPTPIERRRLPRSRSNSMDRDSIARHRHSLSPDWRSVGNRGSRHLHERSRRADDNGRNGGTKHPPQEHDRKDDFAASKSRARLPRKERSLSPYSKRLAMTQAMNMGR
ncbi:hypothetical protein MMC26_003214 [Xylographa opegraphella]|nr:hypothetical protein [Xylographa opegraphella]